MNKWKRKLKRKHLKAYKARRNRLVKMAQQFGYRITHARVVGEPLSSATYVLWNKDSQVAYGGIDDVERYLSVCIKLPIFL